VKGADLGGRPPQPVDGRKLAVGLPRALRQAGQTAGVPTPLLVAGLWCLWSAAFVATKVGLRDAPPLPFVVLRVATAAVVLLAVAPLVLTAADRRRLREPRVHLWAALLGLTNVAGLLGLQAAGVARGSAGFAAVVTYAQPLLVAAGGRLFLRERLSGRQLLGLGLGWAGVVASVAGEAQLSSTAVPAAGLLLLSAASWSVGTLVTRRVSGSLPLGPLLLLQNGYGLLPLLALSVPSLHQVRPTWSLLLAVLWVGLGAQACGYALQYALLRRGSAGVVSAYLFAVPVLAALLGVALLGEALHPALLVGVLAVAVAVVLVALPPRGTAAARTAARRAAATPGG